MEEIVNKVLENFKAGRLDYLSNLDQELEKIIEIGDFIRKNFEHLVIIGTGASTINSKALMACLNKKSFSIIPKAIFNQANEFQFDAAECRFLHEHSRDPQKSLASLKMGFGITYLDSLDISSYSTSIETIDFSKAAILVISKSGTTHETLFLTKAVVNNFRLGAFFVITENPANQLAMLCKELGGTFIPHPNFGGRFSILTIVGLLPAYIAGVDVKKLLYKVSNDSGDIKGKVYNNILNILQNKEEGKNNYVTMYYGDRLFNYLNWIRQVYAESLGKKGQGFNYIISQGSIDEHSQLQLYLDGLDDKFYRIIYLDQSGASDSTLEDSFAKNLKLHADATHQALKYSKKNVEIEYVKDIYEFLATDIVVTILSTLVLAEVFGIDPYGQPSVELIKNNLKSTINN